MNYIDILGYIGSILVGISFIPYCYHVVNNEIVLKNISITFSVLMLIASLFLTIYASNYLIVPMMITNIIVFTNTLFIITMYIRFNIIQTSECIEKL